MKTALFCVVVLAFVACAYAGHSFRVEPLSLDVKKDPEIRCPGQSRIEFDFPRFIISNKEEGVRFETKEMDYNKGKSAYVFEDVSFKHRAKFFRNLEKISVHVRPINNVWGDIDDPFQPVEFTTAGIHTVNLKFKKEQCQSPTFTMTIQVTETDVEGNPIQSKVQQSSVVHKKGEHVQVIFKKLLTVKDPQIECPDEDIDFWFPYGVASVVGSHQVHASEKAKEMEWIKSKPGHYGYHKDTEKRGLVDIPNLILTDGKPAVQISLGNAELGRDSFPFAPKTVTGYGLHTVNLRPAKSECTHPGFTVQVEVKKA